MQTWKELGLNHPYRLSFLSFWEPKYDKILKLGHHFLNSISQLTIIVVGTMIKCGPQFPLFIAKYANNAIVWILKCYLINKVESK